MAPDVRPATDEEIAYTRQTTYEHGLYNVGALDKIIARLDAERQRADVAEQSAKESWEDFRHCSEELADYTRQLVEAESQLRTVTEERDQIRERVGELESAADVQGMRYRCGCAAVPSDSVEAFCPKHITSLVTEPDGTISRALEPKGGKVVTLEADDVAGTRCEAMGGTVDDEPRRGADGAADEPHAG